MKKLAKINLIMVAVLFATMLVGCNKPKEQTSLDIDDFTEKATIMGKLTYDEGQSLDGTNYVHNMKPAADITVTAVVANSEYSSSTTAKGNLTFTTKTDAEGNFELSIPVTSKGVEAKVKVASFVGKYRTITDVKNGEAVYSYEEVVYTLNDQTFTLGPNDIEIADGLFSYESRDNISSSANVYGKLVYDEGQGFDGKNYTRLIKPAANVKITAIVDTGKNTYTTQTDSNGNFELQIPVTTSTSVKLKATSFIGQYHKVIDVKDGEPVYLDEEGVYSFADTTFTLDPNQVEVIDGIFNYEGRENAEEYVYHSEYRVIVVKQDYSKNDEDGNAKVVKQYKEAKDVDVIIEVEFDNETFTYVASTDNEGVATFNIPTYTKTWEPTINVKVNPFATDKFTYYKEEDDKENPGKKKVVKYTLSGKFEQAEDEDYTDSPSFTSIESLPVPEFLVKMNFKLWEEDEDPGHYDETWGADDDDDDDDTEF